MLGAVASDDLDLFRPRPDEAHLAAEDVPELRQLVEAQPAEPPADPRPPGVVLELEDGLVELVEVDQLAEPLVGADDHRPELDHHERAALQAGPALAVEDRPPAVHCDHDRDRREEG